MLNPLPSFIFPSSEIYGGTGSCYDYGPLGVELKNNVKRLWWRDYIQRRPDMVGLDASILMHPTVWKASGHVDNFTDPMVDCLECRRRFRADKVDETPWVHYCAATKGNSRRVWKRRNRQARRGRVSPKGLFGGLEGACFKSTITKPDGSVTDLVAVLTKRGITEPFDVQAATIPDAVALRMLKKRNCVDSLRSGRQDHARNRRRATSATA